MNNNNKLDRLVDEEVFDRRKSNGKKLNKNKDKAHGSVIENSTPDQNLEKKTDLSLLEKKAAGAIDEVDRQLNRDNEAEKSLGAGLESEPVFIEEASKINKKKTRVKKKLANITAFIISDIKVDDTKKTAMGGTDVLATQEEKEKAVAELEAQITDSFTKFIYNKLGVKNKELLLDNHFADNIVSMDKSEILEIDRLSEANYNVVLFSDNGFLMQLSNPEETNEDIKDSKYRFNIIDPSGAEIANGLNYEEARTQLNDLSRDYQTDAVEFFNKQSNIETSPETLVKDGDEELFEKENVENTQEENQAGLQAETEEPVIEVVATVERPNYEPSPLFNKFVISKLKDWSKKLEVFLKEEENNRQEVKAWNTKYVVGGLVSFSSVGYATHLDNEDEVKVEGGIATKSEKAIYSLVAPNGAKTHENLSYQESQNLLWSESEKYLGTLNEEFEANKEAIEKEFVEEEIALKKKQLETEATVKDSVNSPENNYSSMFSENVLDYVHNMGVEAKDLAQHPEFLELNDAQQQFVLEALNRSSLNKIKVDAHNNFKTEKESKKWYNIGFALNQKFHKKKHEVLAAKEIHEKGLEGYGETELSWLTSIVKNGPEIKLDEDGDVESVNYLKLDGDVDPARQELIDKYNSEAYYFSKKPAGDKDYKSYGNDVKRAREVLLASAKDDADGAQLVNKLIEAEKQLKLHHFLKSDPNNEKIIQSLVDNSLGSWQKFGMMAGGQGDKAKYMGVGMLARMLLRQEVAASTLSKAFSYAIGPVVAAAMGAWRSNSRARAGLKEESELSKLGVQSDNKLIKSLNLAVGSEKSEDGKAINIGLADKLDSLVDRYNLLENKIDQLSNISRTPEQEKELEKIKTEQTEISERLSNRIDYTSQKMESGLVSFGSSDERAANYYRLLNSLENAKSLIFNENYILNYDSYRTGKSFVDSDITDLTRSKDILGNNKNLKNIIEELKKIEDKESPAYKDLDLKKQALTDELLSGLRSLSVEDRLASFLNFKEDKRHSAEFKYLLKETTKGAVMGASFAALGAWIFEQTGLGNWTSSQLNHLSHFAHADQAISWVKNLFSSDEVNGTKAVEKIATVAVAANEEVANNVEVAPETDVTAADLPKTSPEIISKTPEAVVEAVKPAVVEVVKPKVYSNQISSENGRSDSVWRSLREIFKNNSQSLGYKGDVDDVEALNHWAENQTANTIHNSGEITDKVFEGNQVVLENDGGVYHVSVEQGEGLAPSHFVPKEIVPATITETPSTETTSEVVRLDVLRSGSGAHGMPSGEDIPDDIEEPVVEAPAKPAPSNVTRELADKWHFPLEKSKMIDADHVSYLTEKGNVIVNTAKGVIEKVMDPNNVEIPKELIDEVKGRVPLSRFINRGGLDKILSTWSKLTPNDRTVYNILRSFNQNNLTPSDLINKISGTFLVKAEGVSIDVDAKHFLLNGKKEFDMNLDGVNKLVKILARRFGA